MAVYHPAINYSGAEVLLVSFYPPDRTRSWARRYELPFRLGSDESRDAYLRYGLGDAKAVDLFGPQAWMAGVKALVGTGTIPSYARHYKQTGGYFVVDAEGTLVYAYPSKGPADHPSVEELLGELGAA